MPMIRSAKILADEAALRERRPAVPRAAEPTPAPTPKRDLIEEQARLAADALDHLEEFAAASIANSPAEMRAIAIEQVLAQFVAANPRLTKEEIQGLRVRLLGGQR